MARRNLLLAAGAALIAAGVAYLPQSPVKQATLPQQEQRQQAKALPALAASEVINGKSLVLEGGAVVRLASIQVPNVQETSGQMREGEEGGEAAKAALANLVKGQKIALQPKQPALDRKGRRVAFAVLEDGRSVQEEMIKSGYALAYPFLDHREKLPALLALEKEARNAKRGIWKLPYWQPVAADEVTVEKERFQLVQGVVKQVAQAGGNWYLNFGDDYKTDFTGFIAKGDIRTGFDDYDIRGLQGKKVILRGWVYNRDGVAMDLNQHEQIEVLP